MSTIIYRPNKDFKEITISNIKIKVTPLTFQQKEHARSIAAVGLKNNSQTELADSVYYSLRCAIKGVEGISYSDGTSFNPEFEDNILSVESLQELLSVSVNESIMGSITALINDFSKENLDIDGVSVKKI